MQSKKILFFGNERLATGVTTKTPLLSSLVSSGYEIAAIVTTPQKDNRSRKQRQNEVAEFARSHDIPLLEIGSLTNEVGALKQFGATIGILAAYGKIVPQAIIDIFPAGIVNLHPSLLPKHRGPTPVESAILNNDSLTGVSLMKLVAAMDAGPVFDQVIVELSGNEDKQYLADRLGEIGAQRLIDLLPAIISGQLKPEPQDDSSATYDHKISQSDANLELTKTAELLSREIRAFYGWPRSRTNIAGQPVIITQAHADNSVQTHNPGRIQKTNSGGFGIETGSGILVIDKLIQPGGKEMSGAEYLRGHKL